MAEQFTVAPPRPISLAFVVFILPALLIVLVLVAALSGALRQRSPSPIPAEEKWLNLAAVTKSAVFEVTSRLAAETAAAEERYCEVSLDDIDDAPRFEDYPARLWRSRPHRPVLDSPLARDYRTMIREGAAGGPNLAGDQTIVQWGCGSGCQNWVMVDARTGRVTLPPRQIGMMFGPSHFTNPGMYFRAASRLFVFVGSSLVHDPDADPPVEDWYEGAWFLRWNGRSFRPVRMVPITDLCPSIS
jgi:hypothetical protein